MMEVRAIRAGRKIQYDHPPFPIKVDSHEEFLLLSNKIEEIFSSAKDIYGVQYTIVPPREDGVVMLLIGDQPDESAAQCVAAAKVELLHFTYEYNSWQNTHPVIKVLIRLIQFGIPLLVKFISWLSTSLFKLIKLSKFNLEKNWQLSSNQSSLIIAFVIASLLMFPVSALHSASQSLRSVSTQTNATNGEKSSMSAQFSASPSEQSNDSSPRDDISERVNNEIALRDIRRHDNYFNNVSFPKSTCGDPIPSSINDFPVSFYPVYVRYSERNLELIKSNFCQDAYKMRRENTSKFSIQVSSFTSKSKAEDFRDFMIMNVGDSEIGEPSVVEKPL